MDPTVKKAIIISAAVILGIIVLVVITPFTLVSAGERAIILRLYAVNRVVGEGVHWKIPLIEKVQTMDIRTQKFEVDASAYSKDIQTVHALLALNYHLNPAGLEKLYREIGTEFESRIIIPAVQESVKAVTAQYTAQELIEQRAQVKDGIRLALSERLTSKEIIVDDFSIINFDFSDTYEQATEAKQVAQQDALRAKNKLEQTKFEAEQRVTSAKAEAEAIRIQAQAITQQGGEDYVRLKSVEKWNGVLPVNLYGSAPVPFIDIRH